MTPYELLDSASALYGPGFLAALGQVIQFLVPLLAGLWLTVAGLFWLWGQSRRFLWARS